MREMFTNKTYSCMVQFNECQRVQCRVHSCHAWMHPPPTNTFFPTPLTLTFVPHTLTPSPPTLTPPTPTPPHQHSLPIPPILPPHPTNTHSHPTNTPPSHQRSPPPTNTHPPHSPTVTQLVINAHKSKLLDQLCHPPHACHSLHRVCTV